MALNKVKFSKGSAKRKTEKGLNPAQVAGKRMTRAAANKQLLDLESALLKSDHDLGEVDSQQSSPELRKLNSEHLPKEPISTVYETNLENQKSKEDTNSNDAEDYKISVIYEEESTYKEPSK